MHAHAAQTVRLKTYLQRSAKKTWAVLNHIGSGPMPRGCFERTVRGLLVKCMLRFLHAHAHVAYIQIGPLAVQLLKHIWQE